MDEDDPLAKFRKAPIAKRSERKPAGPAQAAGGRGPYKAFDSKDKLVCLEIRRVRGTTHCPTYAYLLNVAYDFEVYTAIEVSFPFMRVRVSGRNLRELVTALKLRKCEYIQEFHSGEHERPGEDQPLIESITVEWRDPLMAGREAEQGRAEGSKP
jgi:hypothetical protein